MGSNKNISRIYRFQQFFAKLLADNFPKRLPKRDSEPLARRMIEAVETILDSLPDDTMRSAAVKAWGLKTGTTENYLPGFDMVNKRDQIKREVLLHLRDSKQAEIFARDIPEFFDKELEDEFIRNLDSHRGEPDGYLKPESRGGGATLDRLRIEMNHQLTTRGYVEFSANLFPDNLLLQRLRESGWTQTLIKRAWDSMAPNAKRYLEELAKQPVGYNDKTLQANLGAPYPQTIGGWKTNVTRCTRAEGMLHLPHPVGYHNRLHPAWLSFLKSLG